MSVFSDWFERSSGYALHRPRPAALSGCCETARPDGRAARIPGISRPCPLYRCGQCGRVYARCEGGFLRIDNPLRYQIVSSGDPDSL